MSFFKSLFGRKASQPAAPQVDAQEEHEGYLIKAKLMRDGNEYQIAGTIEQEVAGETRIYSFIRADKFSDREAATQATLGKARQIIKEQGKTLFG